MIHGTASTPASYELKLNNNNNKNPYPFCTVYIAFDSKEIRYKNIIRMNF